MKIYNYLIDSPHCLAFKQDVSFLWFERWFWKVMLYRDGDYFPYDTASGFEKSEEAATKKIFETVESKS